MKEEPKIYDRIAMFLLPVCTWGRDAFPVSLCCAWVGLKIWVRIAFFQNSFLDLKALGSTFKQMAPEERVCLWHFNVVIWPFTNV